jgi:hypothetical protein
MGGQISLEIYLLCVFGGMTLLAYMIAINSHGPTRLSFSYLIATLMLAGTVWAIVQYVNSGYDKQKMEEISKLEQAKQKAEELAHTQEQALLENKDRMGYSAQVNNVINEGTGLSTTMMNVDLRDFSVELDVLTNRAAETRHKCEDLDKEYEKTAAEKEYFPQTKASVHDALGSLDEAAKYYGLYYKSEDGAQEEMRERMLRQKARQAYELFKKAGSLLANQS